MTESIMDISSPRSYDASNHIAATAGGAYDAAGDMTKDGKHRYEYDAERRISQVDGGAAEYLYSAEGDRIEKRVGDEATETIWVGNDPIAELKPDGSWVDYLYLDGRRVAAIGKSDATYYVADPLGMTRMELSATGDILAQSDMTPFGQLINRHSDADEVPFTGGEQYDTESGLYSYKYRSYNPQIGRWMSPDPSDEEFARVSNPQSLNLYSYVINDPLKYVDELGLCPQVQTCPITTYGLILSTTYYVPCSGPPQSCKHGNCTQQTYYGNGAKQLIGNFCGDKNTYSELVCTGNLSDCDNNTSTFIEACSNQNQMRGGCYQEINGASSGNEYCACCNQ